MDNSLALNRYRPAVPGKYYPFLLILYLLAVLACLSAAPTQEREFKIIYSASLNGNLDGCDCKFHPRAGLVKRAFYLRFLNSEVRTRENMLFVDAGDILDAEPDEDLAKVILDTYRELNYEAIIVGEQEFANSPETLTKYKKDYPLFAHNLALCLSPEQCQIFTQDFPILKKGGLKIGVLALIEPSVFTLSPKEIKQKVKVQDPLSVAQGAVDFFKEQAVDLILLLYHGTVSSVRELVKQVPEINLVILGHEQYLVDGEKIGKTWIFSPGEEGNRLGEITITYAYKQIKKVKNTWQLFNYERDPDDPTVKQSISAYYARKFVH